MILHAESSQSVGERASNEKIETNTRSSPSYEVVAGSVDDDRDRAIAVWLQSGFGGVRPDRQRERYEWFYLLNPQGLGEVSFLKAIGDAQDLGFLGVGARDWFVNNEAHKGGVLVDFVVHPSHRSAAPALMLQRKGRERAAERMTILTGLPDKKAVAVFKRLGSQVHADLPRYVRILRFSEYFGRHLPGWLAGPLGWLAGCFDRLVTSLQLAMARFEAGWVEHIDDRFDVLWNEVDKRARCIGVRDSKFLKWRFTRQPGRSYRTYTVGSRDNDDIDAYFVCELQNDVLIVKDLLTTGGPQRVRIALLALIRAARKLNAAAVSIQVFGDDDLVTALHATQFFERDKRPFFAIVPTKAAEPLVSDAWYNKFAWYITQADEDI